MSDVDRRSFRPKRDFRLYRVVNYILQIVLRALPASTWSEHVALWWGFKFRPAPSIVRLRSGAFIHVDPTDYLQLLIYYLGTFEPHCLPYLKMCVRTGGTIVDVGANIGIYTLESSLAVGPAGHVISIEPIPSNAKSLKKSVKLNKITNVTLIEIAVGESAGSAKLSLRSGANFGMFTIAPVSDGKSLNVEVRPIDDLLEERGILFVDLIKMDIEGSEYRALRGAMKTLQRCRPTILIELCEETLRDCGSSPSEVAEFLGKLGYRGWVIERKVARLIEASKEIPNECECLFVHCDNISLMQRLKLPKWQIV